ncbi:DNA polymerase III subunit gamma/tau [Mycoplasmopsis mucosicanis]|uniref:DNA polymerase III subunit gamma/tau n=1 Tax=Mycoplasmopsis mucosicanis TaxID=458208 RepID=A0A507SNI6_9BACT|nr:DNA polymerase III subunit gamma/tau [Mycoplasmopsis mucosicanis]TQC51594.1 DNA polymerase III subunit gamma/tau [Mycoplasmopsis mucosicanis]
MTYKALYRKYRPRSFDEVKGQDHIVQTLKNIILNQKISHAYLFSGPRGVGKTSVARIFASTLNCGHSDNLINICEFCSKNIEENFDIIEMDAASNNGVKEIRDLRERIQNSPANGQYKVYIIDEVHMLSKGAFNVLLKTLEEPPKHAIFILATTDPQKIPLTILSRVQRYNFRKISTAVIVEQLKSVLNDENVSYEENALNYIARLATGGMRDALSIADQALAYGNGHIKLDDIIYSFGISSNENLIKILNYLYFGQISDAISLFNELKNAGLDSNQFMLGLTSVIKDFIIYERTYEPKLLELLTLEELENLKIDYEYGLRSSELLYKLSKELIYSETPFQLIELTLLKLTNSTEKRVLNKNQDEKNNIPNTQHKGDDNKMEKDKNNKEDINAILQATQEVLVETITTQVANEDVNNDILSSNNDFDFDDDSLISTTEITLDDQVLQAKNFNKPAQLLPIYDPENTHNSLLYKDSLTYEEIKNLLRLSELSEVEKVTKLIDLTIKTEIPLEFENFLYMFKNKEVKILAAAYNFVLVTAKDLSKLKYISDVQYNSNLQSFIKKYFGNYKHLYTLGDRNMYRQAALEVQSEINNNVQVQTIEIPEIKIDLNETATAKLFNELKNI